VRSALWGSAQPYALKNVLAIKVSRIISHVVPFFLHERLNVGLAHRINLLPRCSTVLFVRSVLTFRNNVLPTHTKGTGCASVGLLAEGVDYGDRGYSETCVCCYQTTLRHIPVNGDPRTSCHFIACTLSLLHSTLFFPSVLLLHFYAFGRIVFDIFK
jgi:hypothetical protein